MTDDFSIVEERIKEALRPEMWYTDRSWLQTHIGANWWSAIIESELDNMLVERLYLGKPKPDGCLLVQVARERGRIMEITGTVEGPSLRINYTLERYMDKKPTGKSDQREFILDTLSHRVQQTFFTLTPEEEDIFNKRIPEIKVKKSHGIRGKVSGYQLQFDDDYSG